MLLENMIPLGGTLAEAKSVVENNNFFGYKVQFIKEGATVLLDEDQYRIRVWYNEDGRVINVTRG